MTPRYGFSTLTLAMVFIVGCAGTTLPPALPDDRIRFAPTTAHPLEEPGYATPQELADLMPPVPPRVMTPPQPRGDAKRKSEQPERPERRARRERTQSAEQIIRAANAEATVGPRSGFTASAVTRYDHSEDSIYEVYAAPNAPTFLRLPPGHHLAAPATLNPDEWVTSKVEMSLPGDIDQQGWLVRPEKAGLEAYLNLISKEGFVAKCKLRSFEKTAMLEVAWNWTPPRSPVTPQTIVHGEQSPSTPAQIQPLRPGERQSIMLTAMKPEPAKPPTAKLKAPSLNVERLHTGYKIEVVGKHTPPWIPTSVLDDGSKSIIKFKENLGFTSAPDVFAIHPDGSPAPVEFTPYVSDNGETMMYIIPGLFPQLDLKGRNNLHVKITRTPQK
jgi:type IV secretory pathway VirB9-like protein